MEYSSKVYGLKTVVVLYARRFVVHPKIQNTKNRIVFCTADAGTKSDEPGIDPEEKGRSRAIVFSYFRIFWRRWKAALLLMSFEYRNSKIDEYRV